MYRCLLLLLGGFAVSGTLAASAGTPPCNVMLIGWDAAQRDHVKECMNRGELPHLKKLGEEGALVAIDILRTTDTKAGWSQILTGYHPEVTGVISNTLFHSIPAGLTIPERLEQYFGPDNIVTVAVIGKLEHMESTGPQMTPLESLQGAPPAPPQAPTPTQKVPGQSRASGEQETPGAVPDLPPDQSFPKQPQRKPREGIIIERDGKKYNFVHGKPYYNMKNGMDVFINGLYKDEAVGNKTLELLDRYKDTRFFFFVHFAEIDDKGHQFGENSPEYNHALVSADTWTGAILQKLKDLGLYEKTLVYVTADHGFNEGAQIHCDAPYVFLSTNDKHVIRRGLREDIAPTIYTCLGIDPGRFQPPLDGHTLTAPYTPAPW